MNACISNLRQIDGAIQTFALEAKKAAGDPVSENDVTPYLKSGGSVSCPAGGSSFGDSYSVTDCQTPPTCKRDAANHKLQ